MSLRRSTISCILETASSQIHKDAARCAFTIISTVEEGTACRFAFGSWTDKTLEPLSERIVDQLGWKVVEHSARRQVGLRCTIPESSIAPARCEFDRGNGFTPLLVSTE